MRTLGIRPALVLVAAIAIAAAAASTAQAEDRNAVDWKKLEPEILEHYTALLKIDTSNPPGNETRAALYLKQVLEREGIPVQLHALEADRANLVARLKGNGSKRPILIMGHTDVVGVQREKWSVDPFGAVRKNGYIYGRGTRDDKDNATACLITMLLLKRMNLALDRDVIFVAEAGEESSTRVGINYLVEQFWKEIEAEYALAEGGGGLMEGGHLTRLNVATTEKIPRGVRLVAHGTAGHGSVPRPDNAIVHLASAVAKVAAWEPPMKLNDTTRTYFERLATISPAEKADRYLHLADPERSAAIQRYFAEHEMSHYSMLRTSISPTILKGGFRQNVIPSEAEATLDVRALPDEDLDQFYSAMEGVIGDPAITIERPKTTGRPSGAPSRLDTEMFRTLERVQREMYPQAITLPVMMTGATDMAQLRARGIQAYGVGPWIDERDAASGGGAHSDDERIEERALFEFVRFLWRAVSEMAVTQGPRP